MHHRLRHLLLGLSALFVLLGSLRADTPAIPASAADPKPLHVVAWNIEWFPGLRLDPTPEAAAAHMRQVRRELRRIDPDVFIGTEMRDWQSFADAVTAVPRLRPVVVSSFRSLYSPGLWPQQIGIAAKPPVVASWAERWREHFATNPRGFSLAVIRAPGDEQGVILVYGVHLKSNRARNEQETRTNELMREDSIAQLLNHVAEMKRFTFRDRVRGVIVGGDFNTNHDGQFGDRTLAMLEEAGFHNTFAGVPREERLTWRGSDRFEPTTFDYIFTRGFHPAQARMIEVEAGVSDHWPVAVELRLK